MELRSTTEKYKSFHLWLDLLDVARALEPVVEEKVVYGQLLARDGLEDLLRKEAADDRCHGRDLGEGALGDEAQRLLVDGRRGQALGLEDLLCCEDELGCARGVSDRIGKGAVCVPVVPESLYENCINIDTDGDKGYLGGQRGFCRGS